MNKILIALVLAVVMSGNAYASDKLYYICNDEESNEIKTWVIDKSIKSAYIENVSRSGNILKTKYALRLYEYVIHIGNLFPGRSEKNRFEVYYKLDRQTLKLSFQDGNYNIPIIHQRLTKFCKISEELETSEIIKKTSTARKLKYEKSLKF
ncbi:hypothetical protein N9D00_06480 [Hyphomicrobiales bacterium]|nr:hypothetical protein [Hyphomicrobiales bacterium]